MDYESGYGLIYGAALPKLVIHTAVRGGRAFWLECQESDCDKWALFEPSREPGRQLYTCADGHEFMALKIP